MLVHFKIKLFLLLLICLLPAANAAPYMALSAAQIKIKTDTGSTKPSVTDFRLGYEVDIHKIELVYMTSINDDNLNELVTDVPAVTSLFYRYNASPDSAVKFEFILGYSQLEIESSYINEPSAIDTFEGVSYGIGLEEALQSIPQLKFKLDFIRLYRGDALDLSLLAVGLRYEF